NAPFGGLFVDDEGPLVFVRNGEHGVTSGGDILPTQRHIRIGNERSRLICPSPPDLPEWNKVTKNLPPLHAGAGIVHLDCLAVRELALRVGRGAWPLALVLLCGGNNRDHQEKCG